MVHLVMIVPRHVQQSKYMAMMHKLIIYDQYNLLLLIRINRLCLFPVIIILYYIIYIKFVILVHLKIWDLKYRFKDLKYIFGLLIIKFTDCQIVGSYSYCS